MQEYLEDIDPFIRSHKPLVLTLNHQAAIAPDLVDGIICVDEYRLLNEGEFLASCGKPIYSARRRQDADTRSKLSGANVRDYDCVLQSGRFEAFANGCVIPVPLAFAYALALCIAGGARHVFLVGFDGFAANDSRQAEMLELLRVVGSYRGDMTITALTPTNYPVAQGSIYADYRYPIGLRDRHSGAVRFVAISGQASRGHSRQTDDRARLGKMRGGGRRAARLRGNR